MWCQQFVTHKHTCWSPLAAIDVKGPLVTGLSIKCGIQCSILWSNSHTHTPPPSLQHLIQMSAAPDNVCVFQLSPRPIFILSAAPLVMIGFQHEIKNLFTLKLSWSYFAQFISLRYSKKEKKIFFLHYLSSKCNYLLWHSLSVDVTCADQNLIILFQHTFMTFHGGFTVSWEFVQSYICFCSAHVQLYRFRWRH